MHNNNLEDMEHSSAHVPPAALKNVLDCEWAFVMLLGQVSLEDLVRKWLVLSRPVRPKVLEQNYIMYK